jgi:glycosyltransferase involved in cell wall biosynthesis
MCDLCGVSLLREGGVMRVAMLMRTFNEDRRMLMFAINSILRQTHANLRLYVYNDGGQSIAWVRDRVHDDRLVVVDGQVNRGRSGAANALLDLIGEDCDAFLFHDSDDQMAPRCLERMVAAAGPLAQSPFWYVRSGFFVEWKQSDAPVDRLKAADTFFRDEYACGDVWVWRIDTIGIGVYGSMQSILLPRVAREVRFDEQIAWSEDMGWTWELEDWAIEQFGLYQGGSMGVLVLPPRDGVFLYLRPKSLSGKYKGMLNYEKRYGNYALPFTTDRKQRAEKRKLMREQWKREQGERRG